MPDATGPRKVKVQHQKGIMWLLILMLALVHNKGN